MSGDRDLEWVDESLEIEIVADVDVEVDVLETGFREDVDLTGTLLRAMAVRGGAEAEVVRIRAGALSGCDPVDNLVRGRTFGAISRCFAGGDLRTQHPNRSSHSHSLPSNSSPASSFSFEDEPCLEDLDP